MTDVILCPRDFARLQEVCQRADCGLIHVGSGREALSLATGIPLDQWPMGPHRVVVDRAAKETPWPCKTNNAPGRPASEGER